MDEEYRQILAKVRLDRAMELLSEAQELLAKGSYKSANNRAFFHRMIIRLWRGQNEFEMHQTYK